MAQNYTRQSSFDDGDTITASLFNNEFNQIVNALAYSASSDSSTGHKHDGNSGQGGNIPQIGDIDFLNKIVVDGTNNRWGFFVQVGGVSVEQIRVQDGAIVPVTDSDIDLGTSSLEFKDLFLDGTAHIDTLDVDTNATVAGTLGVTGNTTVGGTLGVTGVLTGTSLDISGNVDIDGVTNLDVVDIDGAVDMASTLTVTGVLTGTSLDISGNVDVDGVTNLDVVDIDGAVNMATTLIVTGNVDFDGDLDVDGTTNLDAVDIDGAVNMATTALVTGVLTTTATQVATGGITSGSNIVSDTDSTDDLGTTSVRWANLFVDSITATDQITATGFTGTLDGILGSGAAAAATVTTLDTSGAVNLNLITDSSSSTSGALIVDGGVGIAKKLYVGTDLDVDGTTNLDVVDIDGAVQADGTVTVGVDDTGYDVKFFGATTGKSLLWDESADSLIVTGTTTMTGNSTVSGTLGVTGVLTGTSLDISGDIDVDGTTNLDVVDIDGAVDMASTLTVASNIVVGGTVDGRDVATDGTKLDGIEASATADQSNAEIRTAVEAATDSNVFTDADHTKLNAIEASADVTDTANVTAAGALMDSELTAIASVKALNQGVATGDSPQFVGITSTANVVVGGNLTVNGTTTTLNTATLDVEDKNITVNYGAGDTTGSANGAGLTIQDAVDASTDATILWDTTNDEFDFSHPINVTGKVTGTGTSVFASLDISGDIDVDGTTNLDVVDIDGAVDMASTLQVDGISTFTGQITANGGMELLDNKKLTFGTGDDLEIYHDGSNSYIKDVGTGNLKIQGANVEILTAGGTKYADFAANVSRLYHTGNAKLSTSTAGITVTGEMTVGTLVAGSGSITDTSGAISFGNENLSTTGTLASGNLDVTGTLDVSGNLATGGDVTIENATPILDITYTGTSGRIDFNNSSDAVKSRIIYTQGTGLSIGANGTSTAITIADATNNVSVAGNIFQGTNPATAGNIRLAALSTIRNRNAANNANITMIGTNSSDQVSIASSGHGTVVGGDLSLAAAASLNVGNGYYGNADSNWGLLVKADTTAGGAHNIGILATDGNEMMRFTDSTKGVSLAGALAVTGTTTGTGGFNVPNNVPFRGTLTNGGTSRMLRMSSSNVIEVGSTTQAMDIFASAATVSGTLGIGGANPSAVPLYVEKDIARMRLAAVGTGGANQATLQFYNEGTFKGQIGYREASNDFEIWSQNGSLATMTMDASNNVKVPNGSLLVNQGSGIADVLLSRGNGSSGSVNIYRNNGNNPWSIVGGQGGVTIDLELDYNGSLRGDFNSTTGAYTALSLRKFKDNIEDVVDPYEIIRRLRPRTYNMSGVETAGYIYDEVDGVLDIASMDTGINHRPIGVNHDVINTYTTAAVQRLIVASEAAATEITQLKAEIQELRGLIK